MFDLPEDVERVSRAKLLTIGRPPEVHRLIWKAMILSETNNKEELNRLLNSLANKLDIKCII